MKLKHLFCKHKNKNVIADEDYQQVIYKKDIKEIHGRIFHCHGGGLVSRKVKIKLSECRNCEKQFHEYTVLDEIWKEMSRPYFSHNQTKGEE